MARLADSYRGSRRNDARLNGESLKSPIKRYRAATPARLNRDSDLPFARSYAEARKITAINAILTDGSYSGESST